MPDATNVLVGAGVFYTSPVATAKPDEDADLLVWTSWEDVGYTDGGVEMEYTPVFFDAVVDQTLPPVRTALTGEQLLVRVPMAEATLKNLSKAISASTFSTEAAGGGKTGKDILEFGNGTPTPVQLGFEGESPESQASKDAGSDIGWRVAIFWKALSVGALAHAYRKAEKVIFPVEFRCLADDGKAAGKQLARIVDWTAAFAA